MNRNNFIILSIVSIFIIMTFLTIFLLRSSGNIGEDKITDKSKCTTEECVYRVTELENALGKIKINNQNDKIPNLNIISLSCDKTLRDCGSKSNNDNIDEILQINNIVCDLKNGINANDYEKVFVNFNNRTDIVSDIILTEKDGIKNLSFTIEKNNNENYNEGKNINIMFDLTYFSGINDIEQDVVNNRIKTLKDIISKGIDNFKIEYGDKINLFYIGTSDYGNINEGHKNYAITDRDNFILKKQGSNLSGGYNIKYVCEKNTRKRNLTMYYFSKGRIDINIKSKKSNITYVSNIDSLESELINVINNKYKSGKYNRGTYLLESLSKNTKFINGTGSINILISDMFFQIHPEMKKNKNIKGPEFDFTENNILKLKKYKDYTTFYNNIIPSYLNDKCENSEELYIIGIELSDNLDLKKKMKEYYSDKFFKGCNIHFN